MGKDFQADPGLFPVVHCERRHFTVVERLLSEEKLDR